jgi:hypothetical protein
MGIAALISAPSANGKRPTEMHRIVPQPIDAANYNNFTNMNPF